MSKPVILTGLRANNDLHLGNYLGALLPMIELQKKYSSEYQINLFVPDLHSFTTPIDHSKLYEQTMHNIKLFVAAGLDISENDTYIYRQSFIPAHSELAIILNCFVGFGELYRMTQFKDKAMALANNAVLGKAFNVGEKGVGVASEKAINKRVSVGLFDYPVLMAADILLYGAKFVPVGADQTQHVELARDIAIRMNNKFGELFIPPEAEKDQIAFASQQQRLRVRDLVNPDKKMSKSDETGKGVIFLSDSAEVATKKIMSATTDSRQEIKYDYKQQPGISNLLDILAAVTGQDIKDVVKKYEGQPQYGPLKKDVADAVAKFLKDFQARLAEVDESAIHQKLKQSEEQMNIVAKATLDKVQKAVGLRSS